LITVLGFRNGVLKFLKKDFGHIDIYQMIEGEWIMLNLSFNHLRIKNVKEIDGKRYKKILIVEGHVGGIGRIGFFPFSCVKLAAYVMGIHPWVITPYGLYKYLTHKKHKNIISVEAI